MNPDIIGEAWQAMSVLSDAQEHLSDEYTVGVALHDQSREKMNLANERINHAKRHLLRLFDLAREEDQDAFFRGTLGLECTLQGEDEEHEELGVLVCPLTAKDVAEMYDHWTPGILQFWEGYDNVPAQWLDLGAERRREVIEIAKRLLYVETNPPQPDQMSANFDDAFQDRLSSLVSRWQTGEEDDD